MSTSRERRGVTDPHPDDAEGKPPANPKGPSQAEREHRDDMAVNDYTHDDDGNRTGGVPRTRDDQQAKERSAEFLVEQFDVQTQDAAALVAEDAAEAENIEEHEYERQRSKDPLQDVPTPDSPDMDPMERVNKHMHKDVVRVGKS